MARPVFALRVQAEPGVNAIRSLRAWLKIGLRTFGLHCVSIEQVTEQPSIQESKMVDMRQYAGGIITADDVRNGPIIARIISVYINEKHQVPVLELDTGDTFWAWPFNARKLAQAYGYNSDDWLGHTIKLELGTPYTDKNGVTKDSVDLTPLSSRDGNSKDGASQRVDPAQLPAPLHRHADKEDDDSFKDSIPF
jgi:hypothetical protein